MVAVRAACSALCFGLDLHWFEILGAFLSQMIKCPKCFSSHEPFLE